MLVLQRRPRSCRTIRGWAVAILREAGAIVECEEHGHIIDRGDPHTLEWAIQIALEESSPEASSDEIRAAIEDVMRHIGDCCPECA
jgi:hypothetical protein